MAREEFDQLCAALRRMFASKGENVQIIDFDGELNILDVQYAEWSESRELEVFLKGDAIEIRYDIPVGGSDRTEHTQFQLVFVPLSGRYLQFTSATECVEVKYHEPICDVVSRICGLPW
jgi:hypothetical protein